MELFVSANDAKLVRDQGRDAFPDDPGPDTLTLFDLDAARVLGSAIRHVHARDAESLKQAGVEFNVSLIFGGQIKGEAMRLFQVYSAGNFIEATRETCFFQVGESKYGKPVLDRMLTPATGLDEAAKCALVSMDSTLKSNLSVGLPLDLLVYEREQFASDKIACIDEHNPYFHMIRTTWGQRLREQRDPQPPQPRRVDLLVDDVQLVAELELDVFLELLLALQQPLTKLAPDAPALEDEHSPRQRQPRRRQQPRRDVQHHHVGRHRDDPAHHRQRRSRHRQRHDAARVFL